MILGIWILVVDRAGGGDYGYRFVGVINFYGLGRVGLEISC